MLHSQTIEIVEKQREGVFLVHERFERKFDAHQHSKGQLSYVEDGIAYVSIDQQQLIVPARYFLWIPPELVHQLKVSHSATQLHSIYFPSNFETSDEFYQTLGIYPASDLIISIIKFSERWNKIYIDEQTQFFDLIRSLYQLLPIQKNDAMDLRLTTSEDPKMIKVIAYISENFREDLTLQMMTKKFNQSERTFTRWFKKEMKLSFIQYLKTLRMVKAIEFLLNTNLSISEIALQTGYDSLPAFSNTFFKYTGKRPNEMRKYFDRPLAVNHDE